MIVNSEIMFKESCDRFSIWTTLFDSS